ncbi:unnamed protein product [Durusdinium trenchii]|uniref:Uncharacterized protein n=1 Tax=Durusdinium trenchii TaxID=1381693 RepID=A0ABP0JJ90_9DINO
MCKLLKSQTALYMRPCRPSRQEDGIPPSRASSEQHPALSHGFEVPATEALNSDFLADAGILGQRFQIELHSDGKSGAKHLRVWNQEHLASGKRARGFIFRAILHIQAASETM